MSEDVFDKCLTIYESQGFFNMPKYSMLVQGVMIKFLADYGASGSSLQPCDLPYQPSLTEKQIHFCIRAYNY